MSFLCFTSSFIAFGFSIFSWFKPHITVHSTQLRAKTRLSNVRHSGRCTSWLLDLILLFSRCPFSNSVYIHLENASQHQIHCTNPDFRCETLPKLQLEMDRNVCYGSFCLLDHSAHNVGFSSTYNTKMDSQGGATIR